MGGEGTLSVEEEEEEEEEEGQKRRGAERGSGGRNGTPLKEGGRNASLCQGGSFMATASSPPLFFFGTFSSRGIQSFLSPRGRKGEDDDDRRPKPPSASGPTGY